eukprot:CAMPEP_0184697506 /NCGR_PEP_ID=MMETSP0313-20130426/4460_1 /TAXON_ID=2792 /ORGANISM="Porphyridium aerugineum, Strain SAG 1380-2" /LENGTH=844 /DNA_ID=CAMNT_0027156315 /DNA_START=169 /DNA_END=2703 /DNA_ORIENTATION=-
MAFFRNALKRAENFLESVDESVAEASRRLALDQVNLEEISVYEDDRMIMGANTNIARNTSNVGAGSGSSGTGGGGFGTSLFSMGGFGGDGMDIMAESAVHASAEKGYGDNGEYDGFTLGPNIQNDASGMTVRRNQSQQQLSSRIPRAMPSKVGSVADMKNLSSASKLSKKSSRLPPKAPKGDTEAVSEIVQSTDEEGERNARKRVQEDAGITPEKFMESQAQEEQEQLQVQDGDSTSGWDGLGNDLMANIQEEASVVRAAEGINITTPASTQDGAMELATQDTHSSHVTPEKLAADDEMRLADQGARYEGIVKTREEHISDERMETQEEEPMNDHDHDHEPEHEHVADGNHEYLLALQDENTELRSALEALEDEVLVIREEKNMLAKNLRSAKGIIEDLEMDRKAKVAELRDLRDLVDSEQSELADTKYNLSKEIDGLKKELDDARRHRDEAEQNLSKAMAELNAKVAFLEGEKARALQLLQEERFKDLNNADDARKQANDASEALEKEIANHAETRHRAKVREEQLEMTNLAASQALAQADKRAQDERKLANDARAKAMDLEAKYNRLNAEIRQLSSRLENVDDLKRKYTEANGLLESNFETIARFEETSSKLQKKLAEKEEVIKSLEQRLQTNEKQLERYRKRKSGNGEEGEEEGEDTVEELQMQLRRMTDAALRKQSQLELLRGENRALQHQLDGERQRSRDAQIMAASATRALGSSGFPLDIERGSLGAAGRRAVRGSDMDASIIKFRPTVRTPAWLATMLRTIDRLTVVLFSFLRSEPAFRIALLVYIVSMHILMYLVLHHSNMSAMTPPPHSVFSLNNGLPHADPVGAAGNIATSLSK